jgi:outer membrane protein assembly factor BamB
MLNRLTSLVVPSLLALIGVAAIALWVQSGPLVEVQARISGLDGAPPAEDRSTIERPVPGEPVAGPGAASAIQGAWPWFRGPQLDARAHSAGPLLRAWPAGGPRKLWEVRLGEGYASAAIAGGRVYVIDHDAAAKADVMRCLSLDDGREIWQNRYSVEVAPNHGITRTVPAVIGNFVVSIGPKHHVVCWDAATGKAHWLLDLAADFGSTVPEWYAGQCPLIDVELDQLILAPGGPALLMAVDYRTGEVKWKSPNPRNWKATHASVVIMQLGGRRMYAYSGSGGVAGVAAESGELLWDTTAWQVPTAACPSPVVIGDGRLFCSGGYGSGAMMLRVEPQGDAFTVKSLYKLLPRQFSSEQQTPILLDGYLYGIRQHDKRLVCLDLDGTEQWHSGREKFGASPYMIADGLLFAMSDKGRLTLLEARPAGPYAPLAEAQVIDDGMDAWGPMAMAAGRLIVRDFTRMVCLLVGEERANP